MNGTSEARTFDNESITQSSTPAKFYPLPLPLDRIFVVDNSRSLRECMRTLCVVCLSMIYPILVQDGKYYGYDGQELWNSRQFLAVSHSCDKISATYADIQQLNLAQLLPLPETFFIHYLFVPLQPGSVIGFDTEWRPTMCRAGTAERYVNQSVISCIICCSYRQSPIKQAFFF